MPLILKGIYGAMMFKNNSKSKNYLNCNEMIFKSMLKRRKLALSAIAHICDNKQIIRVIK